MPRFLIPSPNPHIRQYLCTNAHDPKTVALTTIEDPEPALAEAAMYRELAERTPLRNKLGRMVAVMPIGVWCQAQKERWDQKKMRQWLNDPANAGLRVERAGPRRASR